MTSTQKRKVPKTVILGNFQNMDGLIKGCRRGRMNKRIEVMSLMDGPLSKIQIEGTLKLVSKMTKIMNSLAHS